MNSINEKEKKLNIALEELKNLDLTNPELQKNIENKQIEVDQSIFSMTKPNVKSTCLKHCL